MAGGAWFDMAVERVVQRGVVRAMKMYGYRKSADDVLLELKEVCIKVELQEIQCLAEFLQDVAITMEKAGESFGHEHFRDFCRRKGVETLSGEPDLIVAN